MGYNHTVLLCGHFWACYVPITVVLNCILDKRTDKEWRHP
jgi:hypothetical protein